MTAAAEASPAIAVGDVFDVYVEYLSDAGAIVQLPNAKNEVAFLEPTWIDAKHLREPFRTKLLKRRP